MSCVTQRQLGVLLASLRSQHSSCDHWDTLLHCDDGVVKVNRLLAGLLLPGLDNSLVFSLPTVAEIIIPGETTSNVNQLINRLLTVSIGQESDNNNQVEVDKFEEEGYTLVNDIKLEADVEIFEEVENTNEDLNTNDYSNTNGNSDIEHKTVTKTYIKSGEETQCKECGKNFLSNIRMKRHVKQIHMVHRLEDLICKTCGHHSKNTEYLKRHIKVVHTDPTFYVCSFCGKNFKSRSHRDGHEKIHTGDADAKCDICHATVRKIHLKRHMKTMHSTSNDHQCELCAKMFPTKEALVVHMNGHEFPFKCELCGKSFTSNYSLRTHISRYSEKPNMCRDTLLKPDPSMFGCGLCDFKCRTKAYIQTHKAVKHEGILFECNQCEYRCSEKSSLRNHQLAKHEGAVFGCDKCSFKSSYKNSLKTHKLVHHASVIVVPVEQAPVMEVDSPSHSSCKPEEYPISNSSLECVINNHS